MMLLLGNANNIGRSIALNMLESTKWKTEIQCSLGGKVEGAEVELSSFPGTAQEPWPWWP